MRVVGYFGYFFLEFFCISSFILAQAKVVDIWIVVLVFFGLWCLVESTGGCDSYLGGWWVRRLRRVFPGFKTDCQIWRKQILMHNKHLLCAFVCDFELCTLSIWCGRLQNSKIRLVSKINCPPHRPFSDRSLREQTNRNVIHLDSRILFNKQMLSPLDKRPISVPVTSTLPCCMPDDPVLLTLPWQRLKTPELPGANLLCLE